MAIQQDSLAGMYTWYHADVPCATSCLHIQSPVGSLSGFISTTYECSSSISAPFSHMLMVRYVAVIMLDLKWNFCIVMNILGICNIGFFDRLAGGSGAHPRATDGARDRAY